jgi:hypothetical protein
MNQEFIDECSKFERNKYNQQDVDLFISLILKNRGNFVNNIKVSSKIIEEHDKLMWKDFLIYFKRVFEKEIGGIYTPKISHILRELLKIDQELHVKKGIELTFKEWIDLYLEHSTTK